MPEATLCCRVPDDYCGRYDLLVGLPGLRVIAVERDGRDRLVVTVEPAPGPMGCRSCAVIAHGHGRVNVRLVDAPAFGRPVRIVWRKRRWLCPEPACEVGSLTTWRSEFLGSFDNGGASNGGTEANGLIELHRRIAGGLRNRDNYRLRMLLIGGGLAL